MNKDILKEIGLTDYEAEIYMTLLQYGQISAYKLAKKTGLYKQAVYDALNRLTEKGFVSSVKEGKPQLYKSTNPNLKNLEVPQFCPKRELSMGSMPSE